MNSSEIYKSYEYGGAACPQCGGDGGHGLLETNCIKCGHKFNPMTGQSLENGVERCACDPKTGLYNHGRFGCEGVLPKPLASRRVARRKINVPDQLPDDIRNMKSMRKSEIKLKVKAKVKIKIKMPDGAKAKIEKAMPMASGRLIIVRHGATALNANGDDTGTPDRIRGWSDPPLTAKGKADAQRSAKEIAAKFQVGKIYTSDLQRAAVTADFIGKAVGAKATKTQALRPWNLGHLTGKKTSDVEAEMREYIGKPDAIVPGGESLVDFERRLMPFFQKIAAQASKSDTSTVIVTHTRDVRAILGWIKAGETPANEVDRTYLMEKKDPVQPGGWLGLEFKRGKWVDTEGDDNVMSKGGDDVNSQQVFKSEDDRFDRCQCSHPRANHRHDEWGSYCVECAIDNGGRHGEGVGHMFATRPVRTDSGITGNIGSRRLNPVPVSRVAVAHPNPYEKQRHNDAFLDTMTEMRQRFHGTATDKTEKSQRIYDPRPRKSLPKMNLGGPDANGGSAGPRASVRTQGAKFDRMRDLGNKTDRGDLSYVAKIRKAYAIEKQGEVTTVRNPRRTMTQMNAANGAPITQFATAGTRVKPRTSNITWHGGRGIISTTGGPQPTRGNFTRRLTASTQKRVARIARP